jgi:Tol biopolymer transport system component
MGSTGNQRLDSWKEIAAYLHRDVTTVQRWEKREGMPVRRHLHDKLGSVYAFRLELDEWVRGRHPGLANPLAHATFQKLTDLGGAEQAAAVSRDGRFVAFQSDRDGRMDVWMTQVGTGQFYNLTRGAVPELANPNVRALNFSPDGALVACWARGFDPSDASAIGVWAVPTLGGPPRCYLQGGAEFDWSRDGSQLVYHTSAAGDPMFVRASGQRGPGHQIFAAASGLHAHFPLWSPDGSFVYFVLGSVPAPMDVWRIRPAGGPPERITHHNARVTYPVLLDDRTLLYLATDEEGGGPWLYATDVERRAPQRVSAGLDRYTSLAATADGRRLVVTLSSPRRTLWRLPVGDASAATTRPTPISLTTAPGFAPRLGPGYLLHVSSTPAGTVIWKALDGAAVQVWSGQRTLLIGGPEIAADGRRIAFSVRQHDATRLYVIDADGTNARIVTEALALEGAPAWAPDGHSLLSAAKVDGAPRLFRVPLDGGPATLFTQAYALDPVWCPDGTCLVYTGADIGTTLPVEAAGPEGEPYTIPALTLSRGERRLRFLGGSRTLVALRGGLGHKNLWCIDLQTGRQRPLTNLPPEFTVRDFDVSADGREIVLERLQDHSDVVLIDLAPTR